MGRMKDKLNDPLYYYVLGLYGYMSGEPLSEDGARFWKHRGYTKELRVKCEPYIEYGERRFTEIVMMHFIMGNIYDPVGSSLITNNVRQEN